ncbi:MAG: trigger factor [Oscillospiraceae bacterium]|nr:trigger factor [Oscillospiraceae bacterium]
MQMQIITNEKTEANLVEAEAHISAEDFDKALTAVFLKQRNKIQVPGFRRGKATRKLIEATYGEGAFYEDAVNDLYMANIQKLVDETGVDLVDSPNVEVSEIGHDKGVTFKIKFTVKPEVTVGQYKGVEVDVETPTVSEEDIDKELEKIRADNARIIDASDRAVRESDIIKFDFKGFCEGEPFEGGTADDYELEVGTKRFIPGFEEQLIGHKINEEFEVNVTFPENYPSENVKGKPAMFKCIIREILGKETAELDDEFVKDISEHDTLAEFREEVRTTLNDKFSDVKDLNLENAVAEKITDGTQAEIPQAMFENRIDEMARDWAIKYYMTPAEFAKSTGTSLANYREGFREIAEKQVRFRLALEKIAQIEDFQISDDELEEELAKMAKDNRMTREKVEEIVSKEAVINDLKTAKALDFVKEHAVVTEIEAKYKPGEEPGEYDIVDE